MNRSLYRPLVAVLLITSGLTAVTPGSIEAASCNEPAMMGDPMMDQGMMAGPKMEGEAMMNDPMMDQGMMSDSMMESPAMMAGKMLRARDGQCLASQSAAIQAAFAAVFGDGAGARWVQEHERELARSGM